MRDELLNFIRREWLSFLKWTASISAFLITSIITILLLRNNGTTKELLMESNLRFGIYLIFIHIAISWGVHVFSIYVYYPLLAKEKVLIKDWVMQVIEGISLVLFAFGFYYFVTFILGYLFN